MANQELNSCMAASSDTLSSTRVPASPASAWVRPLIPTFADIQFLSILVWLFVVGSGGWTSLLMDGDTGWHIRTGDWILANGQAPRVDLFSFSKPGAAWFAWEWLADVVLALLHQSAGFKGIALWGGILFALYGGVMFRHVVWRGANVFIALPLVLLAVGASTVHVLARPHLWTLVLFAISLWVIDRDRTNPSRAIWLLVPLTAVWTNLHGGFLGLVATLGVLAAGCAIEAWLGQGPWRTARRYALLAAACGAASILNPYGWELHRHVASYLRSEWIQEWINEFQSPKFRNENIRQYEILLLAGLACAGWRISRRRWADAALLLFWAHASLTSARHIPLYCAVAVPLLSGSLAEVWKRWIAGARRNSIPAIFGDIAAGIQPSLARWSVWAVLPLVALACMDRPFHWPAGFPKERFPVQILDTHGSRLTGKRVFTEDQWADYLIYRYYPHQRVFFDGRSDFYGAAVGDPYLRLVHGSHDWRKLLEQNNIEVVLAPPGWALASLLKEDRDWHLVADTGDAVLLERRKPKESSAPRAREANEKPRG
jgi:hypothetical protein